jgi:hypothetical protein
MEMTAERGDRADPMGRAIDDRGVELHLAEDIRLPAESDAPVQGVRPR